MQGEERVLQELTFINGSYRTDPHKGWRFFGLFPSFGFYVQDVVIVFKASHRAKRSRYDTAAWARSSLEVLRALENVGVKFEITGIDHFKGLDTPCVFIANHMSTLETFVLPSIIAPFRDVTFVVKESLVNYPVFKYVMRSRDPVTVGRTNPREDLKAVLEGGTDRLYSGRSMIVFPQTTRTADFAPSECNTIGVKLAKRANVPIVPVALKTDAWANGKHLKDFGRIDPSKKVHFAFGKPLMVRDRGAEEHEEIIHFITEKLKEWKV
ncbi:MAG TPA: lysophospholipid acyltransferase family protein [Thermodesulfovibrionales bacterium]|jgi:1-acyl-sn-glycerol-3-phosphate acyltransferase|nr:lysophospholipid acyltransferase family protein [Thermodesulfovibrionales bacterium]